MPRPTLQWMNDARRKSKVDLARAELTKVLRDRPPARNIAVCHKGTDHDAPYKPEAEHFVICPICGQEIDMGS